MKIILLTGIPGTGKTKIGNYLKEKYNYFHIDLETPEKNSSLEFLSFSQLNLEPDLLVEEIKKGKRDAVITWGFYPLAHDKKILRLQALGAKMFWLDGDRELALIAWRKRDEPIDDEYFYAQIERINNHDIQGIFSPINYDTFDVKKRTHKDIKDIVADIFDLYE